MGKVVRRLQNGFARSETGEPRLTSIVNIVYSIILA